MPYCNYCDQLDPDASRRHFTSAKNLKLHIIQAHRDAPTLYSVRQKAHQPAYVKRRRIQGSSDANEQLELLDVLETSERLEMAEQLAAFKQLKTIEQGEDMDQLAAKDYEEAQELEHMMDLLDEFEQVESMVATGDDGYGDTVYNGSD
ncbi:hypothetical protein, partial, partial [Absidia glauca]